MARPQDDHLGLAGEELPPPGVRRDGPGAGGRATSIRLGPDYAPGPVRQTRISIAPGLGAITGQKVALGPHDPTRATGYVGFEEIDLELPDRRIAAMVYYPAQGPNRFGQVREGEGAPRARAFGGWPLLVLVPGLAPEEMERGVFTGGTSENTLCGAEEFDEGEPPLKLFRRWGSMQSELARAGYWSVALDVTGGMGNRPSVTDATRSFLQTPPWGSLVDPARLGLVGHSLGATDANRAMEAIGARAIAVLGPVANRPDRRQSGVTGLLAPNLTISSADDLNDQERGYQVYFDALAPRHLVLFEVLGYSHYSFFDGLCHDGQARFGGVLQGTARAASIQQPVASFALRKFFDRYLLGEDVPDDLGIDEPDVTTCFSALDGPVADEPCP